MSLPLPQYVLDAANEAHSLLIAHLSEAKGSSWADYLAKRDDLAALLDLDPATVHVMLLNGDFRA